MGWLLGLVGTVAYAKPPNVILILADDLGYGDLGVYGHPYARTPSIDMLAREGTRFTQFYVTGQTCNPSRTGFMTGRFPATFETHTAQQGFGDSITVTELLARNGYHTGHFGKWHIGPVQKDGTYGIDDIELPGGYMVDPRGRDARVFEAAMEFIEKNRDVPFYINIWGHIAHKPIDPPPKLVEEFPRFTFRRRNFGFWAQENFDKSQFLIDRYKLRDDLSDAMRKYLTEIKALDTQVGLLMKKLGELGLQKRTIVVFASDQGSAPVFKGDQGYEKKVNKPDLKKNRLGYGGGLRGGKHTIYEGGVRSPFIIRWPGRVPKNRVNRTSVISATDWLPTIASIAGVDLDPAAERLDGENIEDIWFGSGRSRTGPIFWKTTPVAAKSTMRNGNWKITSDGVESELYDLTHDPFEENDLADSRPEVLSQLTPEIDRWEATLPNDFITGRVKSPQRPIADAGPNQVIIDEDGDGIAWVKLDASGSSDPDGHLSGYVWKREGETIAVSQSPLVRLKLGEHKLTLEVTDYARKTARDTVEISVIR